MITKLLLSLAFALTLTLQLAAQTYTWKRLASIPEGIRYNDIFFVTPEIGWTIHPFQTWSDTIRSLGRIYKTTDGGESWTVQLDSSSNHFRCMGFADSLHGWVFSYGGNDWTAANGLDSTLLFQTSDGGITWETPANTIEGPTPRECVACLLLIGMWPTFREELAAHATYSGRRTRERIGNRSI